VRRPRNERLKDVRTEERDVCRVSSGGEESADELMEAADGSLRRVRVLFFEDSVIFESLLRWVKFSKVDSILFQEWSQHTSRCPKLSVSAMFC
jgi:hypothetical protein